MGRPIAVPDMLSELEALARRFDPEIEVQAVSSIQGWCKGIGLREDNPFLCGKTVQDKTSGRHLVLLAEEITSEMQASVIAGMEFLGKLAPSDIEMLRDPNTFARHLLLHEVAHATGHSRTEEECDRWAFQQLRE
jgi:hypothetical protein